MIKFFSRIFALLISAFLVSPSFADDYPNKPVKIIVAFAPGGPLDAVARQAAAGFEAKLGQPFVLDFRSGANGVIGTTAAAKSPADGYTLLVVSSAFTVTPNTVKSLPFDTERGFTPVGMIAKGDIALIANPGLGAKNVHELIAKAKASSSPIKLGSSGYGGALHLAGELLKARAGLNMIHVPYNGANQVVVGVVGGHVDIAFVALAPALELIKSGQLVALGIVGDTRAPTLPDVPTLAETGMPGIDVASTFGLVAPAGVSPEIIAKLNKALNETLADPATKEKLAALNLDPWPMSPPQFGDYIRSQIKTWGEAVKAAGIEPQ